MQWLRTVDSSLHSTLRTVPPTAPWIAACTAPLPNLATALLGSSLHSSPFPRVRHRTVQHCTAPCTQQPCTVPRATTLWPAACTAPCTAPLPDFSGQQPAQHSTMPDFVPPAAPLKISVNSSLAQPAACCIAFARPRQPAARCTARFPDFAAAANSSQPQPVQHPGQHSTSARLRHRTVSSSLTAGLHSTLHSTFARPRHRSLNTSLHTTMRRTTAQHLCQTLPPHSQHPQQPAQHHAQHPAQHLCQTSPQSPPPKTSPLRSIEPL